MKPCHYCGQSHATICPRIKAIEYFGNGKIKRVEFDELRKLPIGIALPVGTAKPALDLKSLVSQNPQPKPNKGHGHRWTTEESQTLVSMWTNEEPLENIAPVLGVSKFAAAKMIAKLRASGLPLAKRTPGHIENRKNRAWTQAEVEQLYRRRKENATAETIANELNRSFYGVQAMILKLRQEGVAVPKFGVGLPRLWNVSALKMIESDPNVVQINRLNKVMKS